jgi:tight adherence protein B
MDMTTLLIALLGFVTIASLGFVFAGGDESTGVAVKRAQAIRTSRTDRRSAKAVDPGARRKQILQQLKEADRRQRKANISLSARLQQAGLSVTPIQFWIGSLSLGLVAGLVALLASGQPLIALGVCFVLGLGLPRWVIGFLGKRRMKKFTSEFADAIDIIVRGIKSGLPVHDCLKIIAKEGSAPLGPEFRRMVENIGMGMDTGSALEKMYERMPTSELRFFSIVLAIQQKTGGNLAEALGNLSTVLRGRKMMREKIKALSSEATASASIIGVLPPGVMTMVAITTPSYMVPMFTDSRGQLMLLGSGIWMTLGIIVMKRMIAFKI